MKLAIFIVLLCLMANIDIPAQAVQKKRKYLAVGDKLPRIRIKNIINSNATSMDLGAYRGKLLLLDFWSFGCSSCFDNFPKLERLQKKYPDKIKVLLVSHMSKQQIEEGKKIFKKYVFPDLPIVTSDTTLTSWFPKNYVPWYAWIDSAGYVRYITDEIAEENVLEFFNNQPVQLTQRKFNDGWRYCTPLLEQVDNPWMSTVKTWSYISSCVTGAFIGNVGPGYGEWRDGFKRLAESCSSVLILLQVAFSEDWKFNYYPRNKIILEVEDALKYTGPSAGEWPSTDGRTSTPITMTC